MKKRERTKGQKLLDEIRNMDVLIERLKEQIRIEEGRLTDISVHYKDIQVQSSKSENVMEHKVPEIVEIMDDLSASIRKMENKKLMAVSIIKQLSSRKQSVLMLYYMQGRTLEKAAEELGKSYTWFWKELRAAEVEFSRIFEGK